MAFSSTDFSSLCLCPRNLLAPTTALPHFSLSFFLLRTHIFAFLKILPFQCTISMPLTRQTHVIGFDRRLLKVDAGWQPLREPTQAVLPLVPPLSALAVSCTSVVLLRPPTCPLLPFPGPAASPPFCFPPFSSGCIFLTLRLAQMPQFGARDWVGSSESSKPPLENKSLSSIPNE